MNLITKKSSPLPGPYREWKIVKGVFNIHKIREGDNGEWTKLMKMMTPRLYSYALKVVQRACVAEDVVASTIADACISKKIFNSEDHMIGHMFVFCKLESQKAMFRTANRFILDNDVIAKMDWYLTFRGHVEQDDTDERIALDRWRDDMLLLLRTEARRLPRSWCNYVYMHLTYHTRKEYWQKLEKGEFTLGQRYSTFNRLKALVNHRLNDPNTSDRMEDLRYVFRYLPRTQKAAIKAAMQYPTQREAAVSLGITRTTYNGRLNGAVSRIQRVYYDPIFDQAGGYMRFFNSITDTKLHVLLQEEIVESKTAGANNMPTFTKKEVMNIILLRNEQHMSWQDIAAVAHTSVPVAKRVFYDELSKEGDRKKSRKLKGDDKRQKLTIAQVIEVRRLLKEGNHSQYKLAGMFGVSRGAIENINNGKTFSYVGDKSVAIA